MSPKKYPLSVNVRKIKMFASITNVLQNIIRLRIINEDVWLLAVLFWIVSPPLLALGNKTHRVVSCVLGKYFGH